MGGEQCGAEGEASNSMRGPLTLLSETQGRIEEESLVLLDSEFLAGP
jgi:hypothetical protein